MIQHSWSACWTLWLGVARTFTRGEMFRGAFRCSKETITSMPSTADRLTTRIVDHFDLHEGPNFDASFRDLDTSSVNAVAFFKLVDNE